MDVLNKSTEERINKIIKILENIKTPLLTHKMDKEGRDYCLDLIDKAIKELQAQ